MSFFKKAAAAFLAGVVALSANTLVFAQADSGSGQSPLKLELRLDEALQIAYDNNLSIKAAHYAPQIAQKLYEASRGIYVPSLSVFGGYSDSAAPLSSRDSLLAGGIERLKEKGYTTSAELGGKLPLGTSVSLYAEGKRVENDFTAFRPEYSGNYGVKIVQPLLKNAGTGVNNIDIDKNRIEKKISEYVEREIIIDTLATVEKTYWQIVLLQRSHELAKQLHGLAEKLYEETDAKVKAGVVSELELVQAQAGVAQRREVILTTQKNLLNTSNIMENLLGSVHECEEFLPLDKPQVVAGDYPVGKYLKLALDARPDYIAEKLRLEKIQKDVRFYKNQILPAVNVEGGVTFLGIGESAGDFRSSVGDSENREWNVGLRVSRALWLKSERNMLDSVKLQEKNQKVKIRQLEDRIRTEVENAVFSIKTNRARVKAAEQSLVYSKRALDAENTKYEYGKSTPKRVLDYQLDYVQAEVAKIEAVVDYKNSVVDLKRLCGIMPHGVGGVSAENSKAQEA